MMMRRIRGLVVSSILGVAGVLACDGTQPSISAPQNPSRTTGAVGLGAEILSLMGGFPKGESTSVNAKWDRVLRSLATEPKVTLKGKLVPGSNGRSELVNTVRYIQLKTNDATPPAGETKAHYAARLILDMSLYVYGLPNQLAPTIDPVSDVAFKLVQPGTTDTVVTPAQQAAVVFPPGSVGEPTIVVITPDTAYYPANCSGPLDTHLCQYPKFYRFNVFPDVKLGVPAKVQVCHVDAGVNRLPLANHNRFRIAHEKPADLADKNAGSTIVDNVEVLALAVMNVTACDANGGTQYLPPPILIGSANTPLSRFTNVALGLANRAGAAARRLFVPQDAYAIDIGGGGFVDFFSTFGVVDPLSQADLAQSPLTTTRFHATVATALPGAAVPLAAWDVTNLGSGTSGAFSSQVIVANDSALTSVVSTTTLGGGAALVPGAKFSYASQNVAAPTAPGTYFVGTKVVYTGSDSTAGDDWVSTRVDVTSLHNYSLFSDATYSTPTGGGTGGSAYSVNCPVGSVGVGFSGTSGGYYGSASIFQVQLRCAQLRPDGSLGEASTTSPAGLGQGQLSGATPFDGTCSNGVLVGGSGVAAGSNLPIVISLTGSCAGIATVAAAGNPESSIGPWAAGSGVIINSTPFALPCRSGYAVTGLQGSAGQVLDNIGFLCTRVIDPPPIL
jgi:hypothetical protein